MTLTEQQIKQKMAKSVARKSVGSALIPPGIGSTPTQAQAQAQLDAEIIPPIASLVADVEDVRTLTDLVSQYKQFSTAEGAAKKVKEAAGKRIKFILGTYGIARAICDKFKVTITPGQRKTIDPIKLLAAGVSEATIIACTDVTDTSTINISEIK
jgi:hypothetical protein